MSAAGIQQYRTKKGEYAMEQSRRKVFGVAGLIMLGMIAAFMIGASMQGEGYASPSAQAGKGDAPAKEKKQQADQLTELFMTNFTARLGVDEAKLNAALVGAVEDTAQEALSSGLVTQDDVNVARKVAQSGFRTLLGVLGNKGTVIKNTDYPEGFNPKEVLINSAATTLGLTADQLRSELSSGKSFADLAAAHNLPLQTLKDKMLAAIRAECDAAVNSGKLAREKADLIYQEFSAQIDTIVSGTPTQR